MADAGARRDPRDGDRFELETSGGGTWRSGDVIDYATKLVLPGPVTATQTARDAVASVQAAIEEAEQLLRRSLLSDLTSRETGEITPVFLVSDNGPCFKSQTFARYIASRPELTHIRTRRRSPQTNGVMTRMVDDFRNLYNRVRPHETLDGDRPIERYSPKTP